MTSKCHVSAEGPAGVCRSRPVRPSSLNESIHLSQLTLPEGVELFALAKEDSVVVAIHSPRAEEAEPAAAAAAEGAAAAPAAGAAAAPAAAAKAAPKKDAKK